VQLQASSSNCCKNHTHCSTNLFFLISHGILAPEGYYRCSMQDSALTDRSRLAHAAEFRPDEYKENTSITTS